MPLFVSCFKLRRSTSSEISFDQIVMFDWNMSSNYCFINSMTSILHVSSEWIAFKEYSRMNIMLVSYEISKLLRKKYVFKKLYFTEIFHSPSVELNRIACLSINGYVLPKAFCQEYIGWVKKKYLIVSDVRLIRTDNST